MGDFEPGAVAWKTFKKPAINCNFFLHPVRDGHPKIWSMTEERIMKSVPVRISKLVGVMWFSGAWGNWFMKKKPEVENLVTLSLYI
jgi:hypothetical protein